MSSRWTAEFLVGIRLPAAVNKPYGFSLPSCSLSQAISAAWFSGGVSSMTGAFASRSSANRTSGSSWPWPSGA